MNLQKVKFVFFLRYALVMNRGAHKYLSQDAINRVSYLGRAILARMENLRCKPEDVMILSGSCEESKLSASVLHAATGIKPISNGVLDGTDTGKAHKDLSEALKHDNVQIVVIVAGFAMIKRLPHAFADQLLNGNPFPDKLAEIEGGHGLEINVERESVNALRYGGVSS